MTESLPAAPPPDPDFRRVAFALFGDGVALTPEVVIDRVDFRPHSYTSASLPALIGHGIRRYLVDLHPVGSPWPGWTSFRIMLRDWYNAHLIPAYLPALLYSDLLPNGEPYPVPSVTIGGGIPEDPSSVRVYALTMRREVDR